MFTGIVEEIGNVIDIASNLPQGNFVQVASHTAREGARIGDSIAVNGACLTITELGDRWFRFGLSPETLQRTNLGRLRVHDPVNLERSLAFGSRMGGHYVQGHIDGIGEIVAITPEGDSKRVRIRPPAQLLPYIVEKGYIAIDGVSLTVTDVNESTFGIALVAYTQEAVIMGRQGVGAMVNIEVDIIAKYVERLLQAYRS
ncbi:MAG: riboflavin synthase [Roseiflexus castenholzii]|uniref:riboflavin synthase n=1 Tax=Roseiflexus castenholzii TaxID=120962 RepID=UPI000CBCA233|nr:MAG: riboflavin synthase [Roseiflexus castenholzii]